MRVFPRGFDAVSKERNIGVGSQTARRADIVKDGPKLSHGIKGSRAAIGRQRTDIDFDAGQLFDGVAVLTPVEPSHGDLAT